MKKPKMDEVLPVSLRDVFAGNALTGLLANAVASAVISRDCGQTKREFCDEIAHISYDMADAMLMERMRREA